MHSHTFINTQPACADICMHQHICICTHVHTLTHTHICIYSYTRTCTLVYNICTQKSHAQKHMYMHTHVHTCSHAHDLYTCTHIHMTHVHALYILSPMCTLTPEHTYVITCIDTYTHVHSHMLSHAYVHAHMQPRQGTQYFRSPFMEAVDMVLTSPWWLSCFWQRFLMSL